MEITEQGMMFALQEAVTFHHEIFEIAFGDGATEKGYSRNEVIEKVREFSDKALAWDDIQEEQINMAKMTTQDREMFESFMADHRWCWMCGWEVGGKRPVSSDVWAAPLRLENHHIVGGAGRKHVRQNIARLCSICHRVFHGDIIRIKKDFVLPDITLANILYAKRRLDKDWYDISVLNELATGVMPEPVRPDLHYGEWQK